MNPKLVKLLVKGALSLGVSALIGYTVKLENKIQERVDEHFDSEDN